MLNHSPLGQATVYIENYSPDLLFPIPRSLARDKIRLPSPLPFSGVDVWNAYEISWLNPKGKPEVALATFLFPCNSPNIVESKSFKLYLNSFNQTVFESIDAVRMTIEKDLKNALQSNMTINLWLASKYPSTPLTDFHGTCLDSLDIEINNYQPQRKYLKTSGEKINESVYSNLLKSNCLATGQPDWGSVLITYSGQKIEHAGLLKYIVSFRNHSGFAEHCVEQMFHDIMVECKPEHLTVYARYTRRGGLDINPFRSNFENGPTNCRQCRQ